MSRPTPETDVETMSDGVEMLTVQSDSVALYQKLCDAVCEIQGLRRERDEALAKIKELIYIAARAIDLADIDLENDKFGVVSELRDDLEKIKKSK